MQRLIDSYISTLRKAVDNEDVAPEIILTAYRKTMNYLMLSPSGEKAIPSDKFWGSELGRLLARARIMANDGLVTISEFAKEANKPMSTISYWVQIGKLESIVDPDRFSTSPTGGPRRLIPKSELIKILHEQKRREG